MTPKPKCNSLIDYINLSIQKLITKHQWLVHTGTFILDISKTVVT